MSVRLTPVPASLWHLPRLLGVLWAFTRHTDWLPQTRAPWMDARLMAQIILRGWVRHVKAAGFIARDAERIHALYVHPRLRGAGLGRALLDDAKSRQARLELWVLAQNETARGFYRAQGFQEVLCAPEGMGNDENLPDILMVWQKGDPR